MDLSKTNKTRCQARSKTKKMNKSFNRLTNAYYKIPGSSVNNSYNEHLSYDKNGNILTLKRNGKKEMEYGTVEIDNLMYEYEGNQLMNVTDSTAYSAGFNDGNKHRQTFLDDFEYDDYGNMVIDRNKKITNITYNHLNLPKKVTFENNQSIEYLYAADGSKLKKTVTENSENKTVDYLDGFQYEDEKLAFFPTAEGYVQSVFIDRAGNLSFHYVYNYTDHLGNIRVRYTKDPQTGGIKPLAENHYYPFGLKQDGYNHEHKILEFDPIEGNVALITIPQNATDGYSYRFQGQEHQDELGLNWDSFKYRNYMPDLGRFFNVDPLSEKYTYNSPYAFSENQVIAYRELEGLEKVLAIFFHGGADGGAKTTTPEKSGGAGMIYNDTERFAESTGKGFEGTIIAPGFNTNASVRTANEFIKDNYEEGDEIIIYGYSYGGDAAVELSKSLKEEDKKVGLIVTVDSSDGVIGLGVNATVDTDIPSNVGTNLNVYQDKPMARSRAHGEANTANDPSKTNVINRNVSSPVVDHGNIQQKSQTLIQGVINFFIQQVPPKK